MGKKSLIKSTTKKTSGARKAEEKTTKKPAAKTYRQAAGKSTQNSAAKMIKKAAAKKTTKAKPKATPKKTAPKTTTATQKVSIKDLVFKKFEATQPAPKPTVSLKPAVSDISAPPLIDSTDPKEVERMRGLLFNKFSMDEIKAAAKEPERRPEPAPTPKEEPASTVSAAKSAPAAPCPTVLQSTEKEINISLESDDQNRGKEPMSLPVKIAAAAAVAFVFLLLAISYNNSSKYYIQPKDNAVEIWKGCFSPKDAKILMTLNDVQLSEPVKEIYTKAEVFPLILNYYIEKADNLLETPGLPDFKEINDYLHQAEKFSVTEEMEAAVTSRLNHIERMTLLYKADVAIIKNTEDSLKSAIKMLKKAAKITPSAAISEEISQKMETARKQAANLKAASEQGAVDIEPAPKQSATE